MIFLKFTMKVWDYLFFVLKNFNITPEIIKLELNKLQKNPERFLQNLSVD